MICYARVFHGFNVLYLKRIYANAKITLSLDIANIFIINRNTFLTTAIITEMFCTGLIYSFFEGSYGARK